MQWLEPFNFVGSGFVLCVVPSRLIFNKIPTLFLVSRIALVCVHIKFAGGVDVLTLEKSKSDGVQPVSDGKCF